MLVCTLRAGRWSSDQTFLSSMTFLWLDSQKPLARLEVIRCQAGCSLGTSAQLHTWGQGSCTSPQGLPSRLPTTFTSLWHIAVTEVKFLSVYSIYQTMKDGTGIGGWVQDQSVQIHCNSEIFHRSGHTGPLRVLGWRTKTNNHNWISGIGLYCCSISASWKQCQIKESMNCILIYFLFFK